MKLYGSSGGVEGSSLEQIDVKLKFSLKYSYYMQFRCLKPHRFPTFLESSVKTSCNGALENHFQVP